MNAYMINLIVISVGLASTLIVLFLIPEKQPKIKNENETSIAKWKEITLGHYKQWISIRGRNRDAPVLLFLHGGPGTPETPFLIKYNSYLEDRFVVASWEQRGAGKSFSKDTPPETMNITQFISDTHELTQYLKKEFGKSKIYLMGHSWGTLIGIKTAHKYPDDYYAYIAIAQTSDGHKEESLTYKQILEQARLKGHNKAIKELERIGAPKKGKYFGGDNSLGIKLKWVRYFGGAAFHDQTSIWPLIRDVLTTPIYTLREKLNYPRGEAFSIKYLYDDVRDIKLMEKIKVIKVPMFFLHGSFDNQVPLTVAQEFFHSILAVQKKFYIFNESAHGVLFEEPEKFQKVIEEIYSITTVEAKS
ncbi:alpha/beta hydrolase [Candidatus Woesebacteria bacterium]|nr:alpha/beta hydrolase [Candidatus Woesebacteria bacterium]